jgi:hypothetical protein
MRKVQQQHLLRGLTGILFILDSNGQTQDKMVWIIKHLTRLYACQYRYNKFYEKIIRPNLGGKF